MTGHYEHNTGPFAFKFDEIVSNDSFVYGSDYASAESNDLS